MYCQREALRRTLKNGTVKRIRRARKSGLIIRGKICEIESNLKIKIGERRQKKSE